MDDKKNKKINMDDKKNKKNQKTAPNDIPIIWVNIV